MRFLPATDIFAYAAAGINEIRAGTGNSKGALCHHFPSKKALAQYLVQSWSTVLTDTLGR
ncbi:TetR family transcriptional regulator [Rhodococcus sp. NPDC056743]|uniref:TetR family transcriptional regulator n=1 Tax=Rhodococcus sp. NPDC056743 TaxID=3345934 RepID=UPI00366FA36A